MSTKRQRATRRALANLRRWDVFIALKRAAQREAVRLISAQPTSAQAQKVGGNDAARED